MSSVRRYLVGFGGIAVSVLAITWLASRFDFSDVATALGRANPAVLAPLPFLVLLSFILRAQRWRVIVEHEPPVRFWPSFRALMIGYLLNILLPARAGDLARALELGRTESISRTKVLATLVTERTAELGYMLLLLSVVLLSYPALPPWLKQAGFGVAMVTAIALGFLVIAHSMGQKFVPWLHALISHRLPRRLGMRFEEIAYSGLAGIAGMFRPARAFGFVFLTTIIWSVEVAVVYLIASAIGIDLALGNALFVLLSIAMGTMVPSSPGFIGTYEFFGVAALNIIGISGTVALAFIVALHAATLLGATIIGAICFLLRSNSSKPGVEMGSRTR